MQISSTIKGIIAGVIMVVINLLLYYYDVQPSSGLQYSGYIVFGFFIVWSILSFSKKNNTNKFAELFNQGFRCFIVVALIMAVFTIIFYKANTKLINEKAELTKKELLKTEKNRTPAEIDKMIENGKKNFAVFAASAAIFQYLLIGVIVAVTTAGSLSLRKNK